MAFTIEHAVCVAESPQAICVVAPVLDKSEWIPLSQVDDDSEVYKKGTRGDLIITEWLAEKKGWL